MKRIAVALCLFFCLAVSTFAGERVSILRIIDGDTLRVWNGETETTVRLLGIDTPETRPNEKTQRDAAEWGVPIEDITRAGGKAKAFVIAIAPPGIEVSLAADGVDAYGRTLAYVTLPDGRSLNELLLRAGAALAPQRYRHDQQAEYAELQREARERNRGFWKTIWKHL